MFFEKKIRKILYIEGEAEPKACVSVYMCYIRRIAARKPLKMISVFIVSVIGLNMKLPRRLHT